MSESGPVPLPRGDRALVALRRATARLIDQALLSAVTGVIVGVLWTIGIALSALIGASAAGSDGVGGMFAGGLAEVAVLLLLVLATGVTSFAVPAAYLRWAARRGGPLRGCTIGKGAMGFRVVRVDGATVRGRTLFLRDLMLGITLVPVFVVALAASGITGHQLAGNLVLIAAVGWLAANATTSALPHDRLAGTQLLDVRILEPIPMGSAGASEA